VSSPNTTLNLLLLFLPMNPHTFYIYVFIFHPILIFFCFLGSNNTTQTTISLPVQFQVKLKHYLLCNIIWVSDLIRDSNILLFFETEYPVILLKRIRVKLVEVESNSSTLIIYITFLFVYLLSSIAIF